MVVTDHLATKIIATLDVLPTRITLILHDVHEVAAPTPLGDLEMLLAARPAGVRLVICSRLDIPLSIGALRTAGQLREIRVDQLRFSANETAEMLRRLDLHLDDAQSQEVHARTGGWPASVRLAGVALRRGSASSTFLERFAAAQGRLPRWGSAGCPAMRGP